MPIDNLFNNISSDNISSIWDLVKKYPERHVSYFKYKSEGLKYIREKNLDALEGNAFEHSYMSAQLSIEYNVKMADFLGWSQEISLFLVRDVPNSFLDQNLSILDKQMLESMGDIYNNKIGHKVGVLVKRGIIKRDQIADILENAIKTGQLVVDKQKDSRVYKLGYDDPSFDLNKAMNYKQNK